MSLKLFKRNPPPTPVSAPLFVQPTATENAPAYLKTIVGTVEETWEAPDAAQYQHSFDGYIQDTLLPIAQLEDELEAQRLQFRLKVERMIEIAPDLFDKALRKSGLEVGYFVGEPRDAD
ncbi:MAG: hypothetical protein AAF511_09085 [Pseudomonadota bacterium]